MSDADFVVNNPRVMRVLKAIDNLRIGDKAALSYALCGEYRDIAHAIEAQLECDRELDEQPTA